MRYLLAFLLITPAFAQPSYDAALAICRAHSITVSTDNPAKAMQAQEADFQSCIMANLPDPQRRELALHKSRAGICNTDADNEVKRDKLTTAAERTRIYSACMSQWYIVQ